MRDKLDGFREDRSRLRAFVTDLRRTVSDKLDGLREERSIRSDAMRDKLDGLREERSIRSDAMRDKLDGFRKDHSTMSADLRGRLREVQADLSAARRAWNGASPVEPKVAKPKRSAPQVVEEIASPTEKRHDDLTFIKGIGKGMKQHLNAVGIYSVAQIAASAPDTLRSALGTSTRLADVESWIEQAKGLVEK